MLLAGTNTVFLDGSFTVVSPTGNGSRVVNAPPTFP